MIRHAAVALLGLSVLVGACAPSGRDAVTQPATAAPAPALAVTVAAAGPAPVTSTASGTPAAAPPGTVPAPPPPRPPPLGAATILRSAAALEPGGRVALSPETEIVVHPAATFEVQLSARAADARLVLVDARDDLVPGSATRELSVATTLTLAPAAPLVPGSRYALRLDGASDRQLHDDAGRVFSSLTLPLLVAGSPPPPEPKKPLRKKRRR